MEGYSLLSEWIYLATSLPDYTVVCRCRIVDIHTLRWFINVDLFCPHTCNLIVLAAVWTYLTDLSRSYCSRPPSLVTVIRYYLPTALPLHNSLSPEHQYNHCLSLWSQHKDCSHMKSHWDLLIQWTCEIIVVFFACSHGKLWLPWLHAKK